MNRSVVFSRSLWVITVFLGFVVLGASMALANHDPNFVHVCTKNGQVELVSAEEDCKQGEVAVTLATEAALSAVQQQNDGLRALVTRLVGNKAAVFTELGSSGSSSIELSGAKVRMSFCESFGVDCLELVTGTLTPADESSVITFDASNSPNFAAIVDRLTNGANNHIDLQAIHVHADGSEGGGGGRSAPERSLFFDGSFQVSSGLDDTHTPFVDLKGLEIGSISVSVRRLSLFFPNNIGGTDIDFEYQVFFELPVD